MIDHQTMAQLLDEFQSSVTDWIFKQTTHARYCDRIRDCICGEGVREAIMDVYLKRMEILRNFPD